MHRIYLVVKFIFRYTEIQIGFIILKEKDKDGKIFMPLIYIHEIDVLYAIKILCISFWID